MQLNFFTTNQNATTNIQDHFYHLKANGALLDLRFRHILPLKPTQQVFHTW